jgi:hypothetical protein
MAKSTAVSGKPESHRIEADAKATRLRRMPAPVSRRAESVRIVRGNYMSKMIRTGLALALALAVAACAAPPPPPQPAPPPPPKHKLDAKTQLETGRTY